MLESPRSETSIDKHGETGTSRQGTGMEDGHGSGRILDQSACSEAAVETRSNEL